MKAFRRWGCFAVAFFSIVTIPYSILDSIDLVRLDRKLILILPIAWAIRLAITWWFLRTWWTLRPSKNLQISK